MDTQRRWLWVFHKCGSPGMEAVARWTAVLPLQLVEAGRWSSPSLGSLWLLELQNCLLWVNSANSASLGGLGSYGKKREEVSNKVIRC